MPALVVCPLSRLPETVAESGASHLLTLLSGETVVERPASIPPERHAQIRVNDIAAAREGYVLPEEAHVARILEVARAWDRRAPLVIHCYAGISRSPAAAYAAACALGPERDEAELARALRRASPSATPNRLIVEIADRLLGRQGRMSEAIAGIGRGAEAFEGEVFRIAVGAPDLAPDLA